MNSMTMQNLNQKQSVDNTAVLQEQRTFAVELRGGKVIEADVPALVLDPTHSWEENFQKIQGADSVAIFFPKAVDGRGLSLAARIREISAQIQLHAIGALHVDMIYFLRRCGVDICHLPEKSKAVVDEQTQAVKKSLLQPFSLHYQQSADSIAGQLADKVQVVLGTQVAA